MPEHPTSHSLSATLESLAGEATGGGGVAGSMSIASPAKSIPEVDVDCVLVAVLLVRRELGAEAGARAPEGKKADFQSSGLNLASAGAEVGAPGSSGKF